MKQEPMWRRYARMLGANPRADTEEELSLHYELRVRDYMRRGMDEDAARVAARERLGDLDAVRRECGDEGERFVRLSRRREWLGEFRQDLKYGARVLMRSPGFAVVATLTLALGIGVTTAIFSVVNRVLLAPLPYPAADRLVNVWEHSPQGQDHNAVSPGNYVEWSTRTKSFEAIGAYQGPYGVALTGEGEPQQINAVSVTPSAMRALAAAPLLGRTMTAEDANGSGDVVLLSHALWQQRFGGDARVTGRTLLLDEIPHQIIGVMPASFEYPHPEVDVWRPFGVSDIAATERRSHNYSVIARLKTDVTVQQARAEMATLAASLAGEYPQFMKGWGVNVVPLHEDLTADVRLLLLVLFATVAVVLLIACGNLANLLLARAVARENEMAVRGALGAGRARIARQLLTECLLIALAGGVVGLLFAGITVRALLAAAPDTIPMLQQVTLDWSVLAFAGAVTIASTLVFGLVPALRLSRTDLQSSLRARGAAAMQHARLRGALLVAEVSLSVVLLVGAGLLVRSFRELQRTDLGFPSDDLVVMMLDLPRTRYAGNEPHIWFYEQLIERLGEVPGVNSVAGTAHPPATGQTMTFSFAIDGKQAANPSGREDPEELHAVTAGFFRTAGLRPIAGREFETRDRADSPPVVIINQALARKHWPNESPIGKRISFRQGETPWLEIVGVVGDTRWESPDAEPIPALYIPHAQKTWPWMSWLGIMVRTEPGMELDVIRPRLQAALWQLDDRLPVQSLRSLEDLYGDAIARRTFAMRLVLAFAILALCLSIVGLYGLMAYTVAQQRQEFGVRLALGARPAAVVRRVMSNSLRLAGLGIVLGIAASLVTTRYLSTLLYGVKPTDPVTLTAIALVVLITATAASWIPARRAVRVDPLTALRGV
ncbi:MAG: ABC transporter permease [Gemmatimonadota bacterium]